MEFKTLACMVKKKRGIKKKPDGGTQTQAKAICPNTFFKVGGINN